jgi:hypothetical protein
MSVYTGRIGRGTQQQTRQMPPFSSSSRAETVTNLEAADDEAPGAHGRQLRAASSNCATGDGLVGEHHLGCFVLVCVTAGQQELCEWRILLIFTTDSLVKC